MAQAQQNDLEVNIGVGLERLARQLAAAEARMVQAARRSEQGFARANKKIADGLAGATGTAADSASVFSQEIDRLRTKFDPAFVATRKYEAAVADLNRAFNLGVIDAEKFDAAISGLKAELASATGPASGRGLAAVAGGADQLATSTQRLSGSNGLRMLALQLNQVGSQGAVTGNYLQALSIQLPDLLLAFGTFGALLGAVAGPLSMFAVGLLNSADATDDLVASLNETSASLGSLRGDMDTLRDLQERYTQAIAASAGASDATAAAVAANSQREFAARRQVLQIEIELLRIRSQEQREQLRNLQDQQRIAQATAVENLRTLGPGATDGRLFRDPTIGRVAGAAPRFDEIMLGANDPELVQGIEERRRAIGKLTAELDLMTLAVEEVNAAMSGEFATVASGSGAGAGGGAGGGGGGGSARRGSTLDPAFLSTVAERVTALAGATRDLDQANQAVRSSAEQAFTALVTGAKDARGAAADLLSELGRLAASAAFRSLLGGMGGSPIISALFGGPSFAGGGFTGMGPRAGGVDGKGGFPAILHPNETVVDHTKGGQGMAVNVVVNIDAKGAGDSGRGAMSAVPQIRAAVVAAMQDAQRRGY